MDESDPLAECESYSSSILKTRKQAEDLMPPPRIIRIDTSYIQEEPAYGEKVDRSVQTDQLEEPVLSSPIMGKVEVLPFSRTSELNYPQLQSKLPK